MSAHEHVALAGHRIGHITDFNPTRQIVGCFHNAPLSFAPALESRSPDALLAARAEAAQCGSPPFNGVALLW